MKFEISNPPPATVRRHSNLDTDAIANQLRALHSASSASWMMVALDLSDGTPANLEHQRRSLIQRLAYRSIKVRTAIIGSDIHIQLVADGKASSKSNRSRDIDELASALLNAAPDPEKWVRVPVSDLITVKPENRRAALISSLRFRGLKVRTKLADSLLYVQVRSIAQEVCNG